MRLGLLMNDSSGHSFLNPSMPLPPSPTFLIAPLFVMPRIAPVHILYNTNPDPPYRVCHAIYTRFLFFF
jgi:hypothetical protein